MKYFLFLSLLFFSGHGISQSLSQNEVNQQVGLVWGLLKYHHPEVSRGKFNWERELLEVLEETEDVSNQKELNKILLQLCKKVTSKRTRFKERKVSASEELFSKNVDYEWIWETNFGEELTSELLKLKNNRNIGDHYASREPLNNFLSFKNEKGLADFDASLEGHRLLLLYNFWNAIQYWYVNKYLMEEDWRESLAALTSDLSEATTVQKFELAKLKMISSLNDSHSYRISSFLGDSIYNHYPAFNGSLVNDSLVVTRTFNSELIAPTNINPGDVITAIEGLTVNDYIQKNFAPLISGSNDNYLRSKIEKWLLLSSNKDSIKVSVFSPGSNTEVQQTIPLYTSLGKESKRTDLYSPPKEQWFDLDEEVVYINLDTISPKELKTAFNYGRAKKAIVLDLRNYPSNIRDKDLSDFLYPRKKKFVKVLFPIGSHPSYGDADGKAPLRFLLDPFKTGKRNKNYYKGKVILLVNRYTMSKAEYLAMVVQGAPNVTTIGEQTAGAPMNIWMYTLSDGQTTSFTGLGGFYPDGRGVQGTGVALDHIISESAINYDPGLYLKEALKIIYGKGEYRPDEPAREGILTQKNYKRAEK
ncbi:C-terminal processing protease CtpA/Prc, contains a PDZ domain [Salinimicrobium sediminis]|uniref:C-terminal processing protease CtpA/Prc, contains a PDZ domain n=1 Tax=Salinimicrobium sediminis TaxID=1343891 RepID=A0A285X9B3_9FLAO|nr:S41 family peptidase [Salinimicrobium sediminis]SOC81596.1 C-terminal processing protease CtpA/Prc, contains a PDZ domain [Salinimicrobium sediminis]